LLPPPSLFFLIISPELPLLSFLFLPSCNFFRHHVVFNFLRPRFHERVVSVVLLPSSCPRRGLSSFPFIVGMTPFRKPLPSFLHIHTPAEALLLYLYSLSRTRSHSMWLIESVSAFYDRSASGLAAWQVDDFSDFLSSMIFSTSHLRSRRPT